MRKVLYILSILVACCLVTAGLSIAFLHSGRVQTAALRLVTDELSRGLETRVEVGYMRYRFPARLQLTDVYLADRQGDTLTYIGNAYAHFSPLALLDHRLHFRRVELEHVRANAHRTANGEYNYQFLVNAFASRDTTHASNDTLPYSIELGLFRLRDVSLVYDDTHVRLNEAEMRLPHLSKDSVNISLSGVNGDIEKDGRALSVNNMDVQLLVNERLITLPRLRISLPHSELDASGVRASLPLDSELDLTTEAHNIAVSLHVNRARLTPSDIAFFVPELAHTDGEVAFSADVEGTLDSLRAEHLELLYNNRRLLSGNVTAIGLPQLDTLYIRAECEDLAVNAPLIQDFVSDLINKPFRLPAPVHRLGMMHYRGLLEGRMPDLKLRGAFRTALGTITTDGTAHIDEHFEALDFTGRLATQRFRLGKMLDRTDIGTVSMSVNTRGHLLTGQAPNARIDASISQLQVREYTYHDIVLQGDIREKEYEGTIDIDDEHIQLHFNGLVDLNADAPALNFAVRMPLLRPGALHLTEEPFEDTEVAMTACIHCNGSNLRELTGYVVIDSLKLRNVRDSVFMQQLNLTAEAESDNHKRLLLTSDFFTARADGYFDYSTLPRTLIKQLQRHLPALFNAEQTARLKAVPTNNRVDLYLYGHQLQKLQRVLRLPVRVGDYPVFKAFINEPDNLWGAQAYLSQIKHGKKIINELTLAASGMPEKTLLGLSADYDNGHYLMHAAAGGDSLVLDINGTGDEAQLTGDLHLRASLCQYAKRPLISAQLLPSDLQFRDSLYHIDPSTITYNIADTALTVRNFRIGGKTQYVEADGIASPRTSDSLRIHLGEVNAGYLLPFVLDERSLTVGGHLTGEATLYSTLSSPIFEADVLLRGAQLNETPIGDATAVLALDKERKALTIDADVRDSTHLAAHVDGLVDLDGSGRWGINILPDTFPLAFINHWTQGIIDDIGGTVSGQVRVSGEPGHTWVTCTAIPQEAHLRIPYTGCTYHFRDTVFMDSTAIRFPNITLYDREENPLKLNGILRHENFMNFRYNIDLDMDKALALDLPDKAGELIQGKVYARGNVRIAGDDEMVRLDANATSVGDSRFRMSLGGASTADESRFITFVDHNTVQIQSPEEDDDEEEDRKRLSTILAKRGTAFRMGLNVDITPELLFQLVLNDRTRDMIRARGDGALRLTLDENNDVRLMGTYTLLSGSMGFTVANMIRRDFTIAEGSQIIWNGRAEEPQLNVTAKYRVTASLKDLFGSETTAITTSRTSIPVNTCVTMTGNLSNPTIRFALELPMSEEAIQSQVQSVINTEEMLMRQVVYLVVFGRFYTPEYMQATPSFGLNETYSILSSTLTGQINTWLGRLTDAVTLGVNIRTEGEGSESSQEYEAQFQIQPINRLIINGNFGYRYNDITNRPFFGDLDVEYILTPNGKLRAKAFTHTVDKYSLRQASTIQGVGFVVKHDFNWPSGKKKKDNQPNNSNDK